jgi:outer membrane receptor for ferrienterochelin and colicins
MAIEPVKEGNVIAGHVIEKGSENSLPYATVLIVETGKGTVTDAEGYFRFKEIPAGEYTLKVQSMGYNTQTKKITVSKDFTVDVHFVMEEETIMTDEVVVSANRNETSREILTDCYFFSLSIIPHALYFQRIFSGGNFLKAEISFRIGHCTLSRFYD